MRQMIYPETRSISDNEIQSWANDCVIDGEIDAETVDLDDPDSCAAALEDIGVATFKREN